MALPTTITGTNMNTGSFSPPYISSGGNVYTIRIKTSDLSVTPYKATDPTSSFAAQTSWTPAASNGFYRLWVMQVSNVLHVFAASSLTVTNSPTYWHREWTMDTDSWNTAATIEASIDVSGSGTFAITGQVRSDGDLLTAYQGNEEKVMGTDYSRIDWARNEGSGWGSITALDDLAAVEAHARWPVMVRGASDKMHVFWYDANAAHVVHKSISSANSVSSQENVSDTTPVTSDVVSHHTNAVYYDSSGTERITMGWRRTTGPTLMAAEIDNDGTPAAEEAISDSGTSVSPKILAVDGTTVYALFSTADSDLYLDSNANSAGWGTDTEILDAITLGNIHSNIYTRSGTTYLAYVYDDAGTIKYNEYSLGVAATQPYYLRTGGVPGMKIGRPGTIFGRSW